ncbi:MAG: hypothetical protein LBT51_08715, partial [Fusobacteriaceae bacterium]|nr:hypothetical protein [Fusobacteriaceae bacterium]
MKTKIKYIILIILSFIFISCGQVTEQQARNKLYDYLMKEYGEPFEIGFMGKRSDDKDIWYEAEIYPSRYKGTPRKNDRYYKNFGTVDIKKTFLGEELGEAGDTYGIVELNEDANNFYLPKLKELFGDNVLPVFKIDVSTIAVSHKFLDTLKYYKKNNRQFLVSGGIYIFGRVENERDREWYRTQIYEFVRFLKETGTFEYVDLSISIIDERLMSKEFLNINLDIELLELYNGDRRDYIEKREQILNKVGNNYTLDLK